MFGKNEKIFFLFFVLSFLIFEVKATTEDEYRILACTRAINKGKPLQSMNCFEHCYVMLTKGKTVLDSRGYFQDAGSVPEPNIFEGSHDCKPVKYRCNLEDWGKITDVYDKCRREEYNLTSNNCCSVAYEAIKSIVNVSDIPVNISNANSSIGTKHLRNEV